MLKQVQHDILNCHPGLDPGSISVKDEEMPNHVPRPAGTSGMTCLLPM